MILANEEACIRIGEKISCGLQNDMTPAAWHTISFALHTHFAY